MLTLAQELDHPFSLFFAMIFAARLHRWRHEVQAVQELAQAIIQVGAENDIALAQAQEMEDAWVLCEQGHPEEGPARFHRGLAAWQAAGMENHRPEFLAVLAEMYGKSGQTEEGLAALDEALALVDRTDERYYEAELHRLKGELLLMRSAQVEAEASFHKAIEVAREQSAKSLELRAVTSLSRLWQQQGKRDKAWQMLAEIYGWFTEGFDTVDLRDAKALLDELT
jgi:predicted ATPase